MEDHRMSPEHRSHASDPPAPADPPETDPVCGMTIDRREAAGTVTHAGTTYAFCSPGCLDRFRANPDGYVAAPFGAPSAVPAGTIYTCPMHPEIRQREPGACPTCGMALEPATLTAPAVRTEWVCPMHPQIVRSEPGSCPICGMALEPRTVTADQAVNPELADMTRRFWIGLAFTVPLLGLAMSDLLPGQPVQRAVSPRLLAWVQLVLATPVVLWAGWPFFTRAYASVVNRSPNMFTLIAIGTGMAYGYSVVATVAPGLFPATAGVLVRNAEVLEVLEKVDMLVVDKTGTLTEGKPRLVSVVARPGLDEATLLRLAAGLERASEHPLAAAIVAGARDRGVEPGSAVDFHSVTGKGVTGTVDGRVVALGNAALLAELGIDPGDLRERAEAGRREGQTVMFVAIDGLAASLLGVADPIKASTPEAIRQLRDEGIRIVMLTGDSRTTAGAVARTLGIEHVEAEVLPEQKVEVVRDLQDKGRVVAMAGDGINDAPALAQAHVGIAMGTGTDVAMESAGVTLVKGDLRGIVRARRLSRATMRNIRENLFFAFVYNALGVPIAAGVLYPVTGVLLSPIFASAAMTFSSVSVIANALRLRRVAL
jgi:P-type Cu+ transporter